MPGNPDVLIIGGGAIGCAVARALASAGRRVTVVDAGALCRESSWAAAGLLTPQYEAHGPGPQFDLANRSRAMYADFAAGLFEETGIDVELRPEGALVAVFTDEDEAALESQWRWQSEAGLAVEKLDRATACAREPILAKSVRWALHLPDDVQLNARRLCRALVVALERLGAEVIAGQPVVELRCDGARMSGARLADGAAVAADQVVLAAGAWSGRIFGLPRAVPVFPVRGQMIALAASAGTPRHSLSSRRAYLVPRLDGEIFAGSTMENAGFDKQVTAGGVRSVLTGALELAPALQSATLLDTWAGLRPATQDGAPIIGPDPHVAGLFYATGHFRNGILLAPITAQLLAEAMSGSPTSVDLTPFRPDRF